MRKPTAQIEAAIAERLSSPLAALRIRVENSPAPANPGSLGQVSINFDSAAYDPPTMMLPVRQEVRYRFRLILELRDLRDHRNAYPAIELIREYLSGFEPLPVTHEALYFSNEDFTKAEEGYWVYTMQLILRSIHNQSR